MADAPEETRHGQAPSGWFRSHLSSLIVAAIFITGFGIFFYPTFSNWWNSLHQSRAVMDYAQSVSQLDEAQYDQLISAAEGYNARLAQTGELWRMTDEQTQEYESILNVDGTGVMGYITIPKINVQLPIYHGTDDAVLQTSIGHLAGTSLPVGGPSTHCVLSGHRGLPSARLFTDLDKMTEGDTFTLTVLNETLTYQVDQIRVVEPDDLSDLQIEPGADYCTLVTCTPYGINTHRLLVRGHRIPNASGDARILAEAIQIRPIYVAPFIAAVMIAILLVYVFISGRRGPSSIDVEQRYLTKRGLRRPQVRVPDEDELASALRAILRKLRKD